MESKVPDTWFHVKSKILGFDVLTTTNRGECIYAMESNERRQWAVDSGEEGSWQLDGGQWAVCAVGYGLWAVGN